MSEYEIEEINQSHIVDMFDCELDSVNIFLKTEALQNHEELLSKTFVVTHKDEHVIAYITLCPHMLRNEEDKYLISRKHTGVAPALLIAQLGVDKKYKGKNIGKNLINKCLTNIIEISKYIHFYAIIVDAANEELIPYYETQRFKRFNVNKRRLYLSVSTILKSHNEFLKRIEIGNNGHR